MDIKRKDYQKLMEWKSRKNHKPLIVEGLRQVGKSYLVDKFASENYENKVVFDFRYNKDIHSCFSGNLDVDSIISTAQLYLRDAAFVPYKTCLIFEEIADCPNARLSLKQFALDGRYDVIATGSLLGVINYRHINRTKMPTGYEEYLKMTSLDFEEFLWAINTPLEAIEKLKKCLYDYSELPQAYEKYFQDAIKKYILVGGLPEVVDIFIEENNNYIKSRNKQLDLLHDYRGDFGRFIDDNGIERIDYGLQAQLNAIFDSLPRQLGRENDNYKFKYSEIAPNARRSSYKNAIDWLENSGLVLRVYNTKAVETPLSENIDETSFKLFYSDIGLLMANFPINVSQELINETLGSRKGAIYENLMATMLNKTDYPLFYYSDSLKHLEIDFLIEGKEGIILLEEKSTNGKMAASKAIMTGKTPYKADKCIKIIKNNFGKGEYYYSIPQYSVCYYLQKEKDDSYNIKL